jgi:RNA polymerase sigma-70 factor (ECF subfamily)
MARFFLHTFGCFPRITHAEGDALDGNRGERLGTALERAVGGDQVAFAAIVQEHQAMVFSIAFHYLHDRSLAEDVAQEVFLELYQKLATIQSLPHLLFWLRRVAVHRSIDHGRKVNHRREQELDSIAEPAAARAASDPLLHDRLRQSLSALPEKQRMVVVLRYQEDMGPAEIAEVMEMPVNTVKSTLHRTLEELRKKLTRKIGEARYAFF